MTKSGNIFFQAADLCCASPISRPMNESTAFRYSHDFQVPESAIDALGHVNNVEYLRWVQDVAGAHWLAICPP